MITITLSSGRKVDARVGRHVIHTDQPLAGGGEDTAPAPFDLFLASLGTCAGLYVQAFCQSRGLPTEGIVLRQGAVRDPATRRLARVDIEIELPPDFPGAKYAGALARAAEQCAVKKAIVDQPDIQAHAHLAGASAV